MSNINLDRFPTSTTAQRMLHRVSPIYSEAYTMKWLYEVMGRELDGVWDIVREMPEQAFTQTVTWGIEAQEYKYNITPDDSLSLDERRARLYRKKTSKFPISPGRIEKYIRDAWDMSVDIDEARAAGTFFLRILSDKNHHLRRMLDDLYGIKPSHLAMLAVWAVGPHFFLNRAGAIQLRTTPGQTLTTQEPYIVFDTGLNAAGSTETVKHTDTATQQHSAYIFSGSTLNGRIHINGGGKYSLGEYDAGQDITENWKVFRIEKPPTLNGAAKLNATPTETHSRIYHVAEWRTVITKRADVLNRADGSLKRWTTSRSTTTQERRYKSPAPYYATNRVGSTTVTREDVGYEKTLTETLFCAPRLNGAGAQHDTQIATQSSASTYLTFTTPGRLCGRSRPQLNASATQEHTVSRTITKSTTRAYFTGALLCGHLDLNDCRSTVVTRTVHIPAWRDVVHRHGACVLNAVKHETRYKTITHTIPAKAEKYFSPNRGTLLNGRAVLGDMVL